VTAIRWRDLGDDLKERMRAVGLLNG